MKHLIIYEDIIIFVGDEYTTATDDIDKTRMVHVVDSARFDQNFTHIEVERVPDDIATKTYKYIDGEIVGEQ